MPRSSSHKSSKSHKRRDDRDRSDSEDDKNSREKKLRVEQPAGPRVSRDTEKEKEKRKPSSASLPPQDRDPKGSGNGDSSSEHRKKRKDRVEDSVTGDRDRWSGGGKGEVADKKAKSEGVQTAEMSKAAKSKVPDKDPKDRRREASSERNNESKDRRHEALSERNDESGSRVESGKRRSEKDSSRRESSEQYKDAKERERDRVRNRDRDCSRDASEREKEYHKDAKEKSKDYIRDAKERDRERGSERDKKAEDARHERSDDVGSRKQVPKISTSEDEVVVKKDREISVRDVHDGSRNPEMEKELDKHCRRDRSGDKDKYHGDGKDSSDKRVSSRDEHIKDGGSKDESHKETRYRDKYRDDFDRDQRHRDDRARDEGFSRDHDSKRSDSRHFRDENKSSESRYKKSKLQDGDHESSPYISDHGNRLKDNRGRKRYYDENDATADLRHRNAKEPREDVEKNASHANKYDSHEEKSKLDYLHSDKVDSCVGSSQRKSSPRSNNHAVKNQIRASSNQAGASSRKSLPEDTLRPSTASRGDHVTVSGYHERASEARSLEKAKTKDSDEQVEMVALHRERTPKSNSHTLRNIIVETSPPVSERRFSDRTGSRRSLDIEGQKSGNSKDGKDFSNAKNKDDPRAMPLEKQNSDARAQSELLNDEPISSGPSSFNRTAHVSGSSHPPQFSGSYEGDNRGQLEDRKANNWYKRSGDHGKGRGQGNAWKGPWPSPVANGFIPFQHGPVPPRFHPQQFPTPPLFGVRPSMDMNHTQVPYNMHEMVDRFSGHGRPFGWPNPADDYHHMQVWDGSSNGVYGDESHVYGRSEWGMNRHLIGSREGWEMTADMWKERNGNLNVEVLAHPTPDNSDKALVGRAGSLHRSDPAQLEHISAEKSDAKRWNDTSPENNAVETPQKSLREKTIELFKTPSVLASNDETVGFCCSYLSKLEISPDLVTPELYKQCMSLLGTKDISATSHGSKSEYPQSNKADTMMAAKGRNCSFTSLLPARAGDVFQRAVSLYKKQNEGLKWRFPMPPSLIPEEKKSEEASEPQKTKGVSFSEEKESPEAQKTERGLSLEDKEAPPGASEAHKTEGGLPSEEKELPGASEAQKMEGVIFSEQDDTLEASEPQMMEGIILHSEEEVSKDLSEGSEVQKKEGVDNLNSLDMSLLAEVKTPDDEASGCDFKGPPTPDKIRHDVHFVVDGFQANESEFSVNLGRILLSPGSTH